MVNVTVPSRGNSGQTVRQARSGRHNRASADKSKRRDGVDARGPNKRVGGRGKPVRFPDLEEAIVTGVDVGPGGRERPAGRPGREGPVRPRLIDGTHVYLALASDPGRSRRGHWGFGRGGVGVWVVYSMACLCGSRVRFLAGASRAGQGRAAQGKAAQGRVG